MSNDDVKLPLSCKPGAPDSTASDAAFQEMLDGTNTTILFGTWYAQALAAISKGEDRYDLLERWFSLLAQSAKHKTYTLRYLDDGISADTTMTPMDDLAEVGGPAQLCTDKTTPIADWADEDPMTWYVRGNALSLDNGKMNVLAVEGVDTGFDITGELAPVYTFQIALWVKETSNGVYGYKSWKTVHEAGYFPYAESIDPENHKRIMTWHPTFGGGQNSSRGLTSGAGLAPYTFASASDGLTAARKTSVYEGLWSDCDSVFVIDMWRLRHWNLENSNIAEGCLNYNYQFVVAMAEKGVKRIVLTPAQASNFVIGSSVQLGTHIHTDSNDRGAEGNHDIFQAKRILSIETINVGNTEYGVLNLESEEAFDVNEGALVSTAPWFSGDTERLPGHKDGCTVSLTAGKTPLRVAGIEIFDGAYALGLDPLYQVVANQADRTTFDYAVYECRDSENLSCSISPGYEDTGIGASEWTTGWKFVNRFVPMRSGILFPKEIGDTMATYFKSAFLVAAVADIYSPWRFGHLCFTPHGGMAGSFGCNKPSYKLWLGRPRLSGAGKKRGKWLT